MQLRGEGEIAASDGCQLLLRGGFHFPWNEPLLIRRSPVLSCQALARDRPFQLGKTETHVVLQIGPWTLSLEIQAEWRFPLLAGLIPDTSVATTRLRLDPDDAHFLGEALERLPENDEVNAPATFDLNGKIAVRAGDPALTRITELILSRSAYTGSPVRLCTDRAFLSRAVRLGFGEIEIRDDGSPLVCRNAHRRYLWQPLSKESTIEPVGAMTRIESGLA
ncbi:hypothetical protein [Singulisphaera acidiphila]|uniref:hypothetical protein n=1 Tax=Singulisphaera acidiphila TaxID=466153 RepID=UPI00024711B7|nr:hypothetical protein [Singulisphaera acidiphila]